MAFLHKLPKHWFTLSLVCSLIFSAELVYAQGEEPNRASEAALSATEPTILQKTVGIDEVNTTISLPAIKDTYVASNRGGVNYGGSDTLLLGYNSAGANAGALRILLQFDFPGSIPSRAVINSARIRLRMYSSTGGSMNAELRHLVSGWDEFGVTWSNHEPDWGGVDSGAGIGTSPGWVEWDITHLAERWMNGSEVNDGVIIIGDEFPGEHQRGFWSRNAGNGDHPHLIVDYSESIPDTRPPTTRFEHPMNTYQRSLSFDVEWEGNDHSDGSGIDYYDVQFREPGQEWQNWLLHTTETRRSFSGQNGRTYEFRARAVDNAHNVESFPNDPQARTTIDTVGPTVAMISLPQFEDSSTFDVSWSGSDPESGISHYDIQFTHSGQPWQDWFNNLTQTTVQAAMADGVFVQFRVQATDNAGNTSSWDTPSASTGTTIDLKPPTICSFTVTPINVTDNTYRARWSAVDVAGSGIRYFTMRYRRNTGAWQPVVQESTATTTDVVLTQGDGTYTFEVRAEDVVGNEATSQKTLILDSNPNPSPLTDIIYMPVFNTQEEEC